ncbi:MAG: hypothetical protein AB1921_03460 [Thermodesulfobacteriota bacterium]
MKKFLALALVFALAGCAGSTKILHTYPVPTDKPLYGVTPEGVFYVHESLVKNAQGEDPIFASDITYFKGRRMQLRNGYYVYDSAQNASDKAQFDHAMKRRLPPTYIFAIGKGRHIPLAIKGADWLNSKDVVEDRRAGEVLSTWPAENPNLEAGK